MVLDGKLLRLWCWWEDAFPGKGFNKFHGMFCTIRRFVHHYHMAGLVSEESNEAYNGTLADTKATLSSMPSHKQRINKITKRSQGNLKGEVMSSRLTIQRATKGKRRGPQKTKALRCDDRTVLAGNKGLKLVGGENHVELDNGHLMPIIWVDIYECYTGGKAPKDWLDRLNQTAPDSFTDIDRVVEENSKLV